MKDTKRIVLYMHDKTAYYNLMKNIRTKLYKQYGRTFTYSKIMLYALTFLNESLEMNDDILDETKKFGRL